jgi:hypothetical protein
MIASFGLSKKVHHGKRHKKSKKIKNQNGTQRDSNPRPTAPWADALLIQLLSWHIKSKVFFTDILIKNL